MRLLPLVFQIREARFVSLDDITKPGNGFHGLDGHGR